MKSSSTLAPLVLALSLVSLTALAHDQTATARDAPATPAGTAVQAASAPVATTTTQPSPTAAANFSAKVTEAIGSPEEGKALVVFFRASKFAGGAIKFKVREGETELGQLASGKFFVRQVEPGQHTYVVHSEAKDVTPIEVEAGETYFLAGSISMGFMAGHPNLAPSDAAAFEANLGKMKKI